MTGLTVRFIRAQALTLTTPVMKLDCAWKLGEVEEQEQELKLTSLELRCKVSWHVGCNDRGVALTSRGCGYWKGHQLGANLVNLESPRKKESQLRSWPVQVAVVMRDCLD